MRPVDLTEFSEEPSLISTAGSTDLKGGWGARGMPRLRPVAASSGLPRETEPVQGYDLLPPTGSFRVRGGWPNVALSV